MHHVHKRDVCDAPESDWDFHAGTCPDCSGCEGCPSGHPAACECDWLRKPQ